MQHERGIYGNESMLGFSTLDYFAFIWFVAAWAAYALALDRTLYGQRGLNMRMNRYREQWMQQMLRREMRMLDGQVSASLQNGTAFFASTSLLAIGGALTLFNSSGDLISLVAALPFGVVPTRLQWEAKTLGLATILVYAFFKFAWSYRLFNYVAIMLGAAPPASEQDTPEAQDFVRTAAQVLSDAGKQFNRGQRAFFFALGYLGWFVGPLPFIVTTAGVVLVMWRRQFDSAAQRAIAKD
jgi:uncharacterized membrane protein